MKFKVGDRVRVAASRFSNAGTVGTVTHVWSTGYCDVDLDNGQKYGYCPRDLELAVYGFATELKPGASLAPPGIEIRIENLTINVHQ